MQEEMAAAVDLVANAYEDLKKINPNHELLRFVAEITEDRVKMTNDEKLAEEFEKRFPAVNPNSGFRHPIYYFTRYERVLREAINQERAKHKN
jgi:S-adenosylmethionine:diacylglycerol 3-amino-3-carboxypropyl transferase